MILVRKERRGVNWWILVLLLGAGCEAGSESLPLPAVVSEKRPLLAPVVPLELGGDCSATGTAGCSSGICVKMQPGLHSGYRCSVRCGSGEPIKTCPVGMECAQVYPSGRSSFCVASPPDGGIRLPPQ